MDKPKIFFYGGVGSVTGANFLVEANGTRFLVDCGMIQGGREAEAKNLLEFPYNPREVGHLFVTHAHMDHIGRIPKLVHDGFVGKIISTPETKEIAALSLQDAYKVMIAKEKSGTINASYGEEDVKKAMELWQSVPYEETYEFSGIKTHLRDAGHILGSTIFEFEVNDMKIVFTGDLGNSPSPLLRDTTHVKDADYLIMESVYGDRNHEAIEERSEKLKKIINDTIERGGRVVIPAFSIERTQVILSELDNLIESGQVASVPVFLDSPLATHVTEVYERHSNRFNDRVQKEIKAGDSPFNFPKLEITLSQRESASIEKIKGPKIIIAGSGMSEGGRVRRHEKEALPDPKNTILLVGYQPVGTLGRYLEEGLKKVQIDREWVPVRAQIAKIDGYSAHADSDHLLEFVEKAAESGTLKKVFVCMGEPKSSLFLVQRMRDYLNVEAVYPQAAVGYIV